MRITLWLGMLLLAGCAAPDSKIQAGDDIQRAMNQAAQNAVQPSKPDAVNNALLPPLDLGMPKLDSKSLDTKFDLAVNNTPASQVFMSIVSGTRYSMLLNPDVSGNISLNLKDVTVFDALEAIREMYGYDYKIVGTRIYIQSLSLQTRIFQVNYLTGDRKGTSSLRVISGSVSDNPMASGMPGMPGAVPGMMPGVPAPTGVPGTPGSGTSQESSKVTMTSNSDFWEELQKSL
ncbi:MAG: secretin N-terminal domain-containing protein, partial [Gallionella sp.]